MLAVKTGDFREFVEDLPLVGRVRGAVPLRDGLNQFSSSFQTPLLRGGVATALGQQNERVNADQRNS